MTVTVASDATVVPALLEALGITDVETMLVDKVEGRRLTELVDMTELLWALELVEEADVAEPVDVLVPDEVV